MTELTMLAEMMDPDLEVAVERLCALGISRLDLKNHVFGRAIDDLDDECRERLAALLERSIANMIETARVVRPDKVRVLSCQFDERGEFDDATAYLDARAPWIYAAYRDAIDQVEAAGLRATIENEPNTIFSSPDETVAFFRRLERPRATFTWDVQNMWQSGAFPSLPVYQTLRPVMDHLHLQGGRASPDAPEVLAFRAPWSRRVGWCGRSSAR